MAVRQTQPVVVLSLSQQERIAVARIAVDRSTTMAQVLRDAVTEWISDLGMVRVLHPDPVASMSAKLPDTAVAAMRLLELDPDTRRLNLWLSLLSDAGWPVTATVAPLLKVSRRKVSERVAGGRRVLKTAKDLPDLMARNPAVPEPPVASAAMTGTIVRRRNVEFTMPHDMLAGLREKASRLGMTDSQALSAAVHEELGRIGDDPALDTLEPVVVSEAPGGGHDLFGDLIGDLAHPRQ